MTKSGLPKSVRKFIRLEKARIRAQILDFKKQEEMIRELYDKMAIKKPQETPVVFPQQVRDTTGRAKETNKVKVKSEKLETKVKKNKLQPKAKVK